ncbi:uncharacterized protein L3040_007915 [Drepanopeziza brunnea f. sp. 'multigermtubi']|uniref:uncharacterized protein n=1 Tax=Drepanopeziza brunnea f. sp. 'multigermtubi' TaxID=698441 RepID=UPI00239ECD40|nr:hypothetical protein L3040_007915 [Drepanopeziza brunnea f. sp. 'multigermtubi']
MTLAQSDAVYRVHEKVSHERVARPQRDEAQLACHLPSLIFKEGRTIPAVGVAHCLRCLIGMLVGDGMDRAGLDWREAGGVIAEIGLNYFFRGLLLIVSGILEPSLGNTFHKRRLHVHGPSLFHVPSLPPETDLIVVIVVTGATLGFGLAAASFWTAAVGDHLAPLGSRALAVAISSLPWRTGLCSPPPCSSRWICRGG